MGDVHSYHQTWRAVAYHFWTMDLKSLIAAQDGKAIPAHPALLDAGLQYTPDPVVMGTRTNKAPFGQREASRHLMAYGGQTDAIDWVMNGVRLITETASSAEWGFERKGIRLHNEVGPESPDDAQLAPYMLVKLFSEPNPFMSYEELIELTLIDYLLVGNAYWLKFRTNDAGQPLALYRLAPPFIKIKPGQLGVEKYIYQVPGYDPVEFQPSEVMHFKMPNPHNPYLGLGLVQGAARMLDMELALTDTIASYYEKKAQPSMVVQSDRRVPKDVFNRLRSQLRAMYSGPRNAGALMVLEAGLKYESIAPSAQEAAFENLTRLSRDRILSMLRVPGSLLGISDSSSVASKITDDQRLFDTKTMRPLLNRLQRQITRDIVKSWDLKFVIDYDYLMPVEERIRLASGFAALPGVRLREVREYVGLERLGDERDEMILNLPGIDGTPGDTHAGIPDNNLNGEGGRPPNPANTAAFPAAGGALPKGANVSRRPSLAKADNKKAFDAEAEAVEERSLTEISMQLREIAAAKETGQAKAMEPARIVERPDVLQDDRVAAVDVAAATLRADLRSAVVSLERALLDETARELEGKAIGSRLRSRLRKSEAWTTFMASISGAMERAARASISASVVQQNRLGHSLDEELDFDSMAKEIIYRQGGVRKITQNLKDEIGQKVGLALKEGQSRKDVERAIREAVDFWRETKSETIALTEATHAYNEGTLTVGELTGHTHVYVHDGNDDDEPCIQANGSLWDIAHARDNRIEHPRCRRAFSLVPVDEVE